MNLVPFTGQRKLCYQVLAALKRRWFFRNGDLRNSEAIKVPLKRLRLITISEQNQAVLCSLGNNPIQKQQAHPK